MGGSALWRAPAFPGQGLRHFPCPARPQGYTGSKWDRKRGSSFCGDEHAAPQYPQSPGPEAKPPPPGVGEDDNWSWSGLPCLNIGNRDIWSLYLKPAVQTWEETGKCMTLRGGGGCQSRDLEFKDPSSQPCWPVQAQALWACDLS